MKSLRMGHIDEAFKLQTPDGRTITFTPVQGNSIDFSKPYQRRSPRPLGSGWGVQLFIGLSVNGVQTWEPEQVRSAVREVRSGQLTEGEHGASVTPMLGYWTKSGSPEHGDEASVSVRIESLSGEGDPFQSSGEKWAGQFYINMLELAYALCEGLQQETIYVQFYQNGIVRVVVDVGLKQ